MVKYLTQHMAYGFISCTSDFFIAQPVDHVRLAYHGCKNLTHTSKTRQVKCTQMVATGRFTIHAFVTFSNC